MAKVTKEQVIQQLKQVFDPEVPVDVYSFGLIYDIQVANEGRVKIVMTLTSEACPVAKVLPVQVRERVEELAGVSACDVKVVFEPRWSPDRISVEGRRTLHLDEPDDDED
ncbi:MAG: iron-sulfur cluster assembly protein [Planctomycetota bacterium]